MMPKVDRVTTKFHMKLPLKVVQQPMPMVVEGGDCGACVLAGLTGKSVKASYLDFKGELGAYTRQEMEAALDEVADHVIKRTPIWAEWGDWTPFGPLGYQVSLPWFEYARMALTGGYYGIAQVNVMGNEFGRSDIDGRHHETNHWVIITGYRVRWEKHNNLPAWRVYNDLYISCSSSLTDGTGYWVEVMDLLRNYGAYNALWAKLKKDKS